MDDCDELVRCINTGRECVLTRQLRDGPIVTTGVISVGQAAGTATLTKADRLLIAAVRRLAAISLEAVLSLGPDRLGDRTGVRYPEGSTDMFGPFVQGALTVGGHTVELMQLRAFSTDEIDLQRRGIPRSSGFSFLPNGGTIHHLNTFTGSVFSHSPGLGSFDGSEPLAGVPEDLPVYPGGPTADREGSLCFIHLGFFGVHFHGSTGALLVIVTISADRAPSPRQMVRCLDRLAITLVEERLTSFGDLRHLPCRHWRHRLARPPLGRERINPRLAAAGKRWKK